MQTLVSTRIFPYSPLDSAFLGILRERGFVALELFATPDRMDLRSVARAQSFRRHLEAEGMRAPWLYLDESYLRLLGAELRLEELTATLLTLGIEALVLPRAAWPSAGGPPGLLQIRSYVQRAGARLLLDVRSPSDRPVVEAPELGFCWDVAFHREQPPVEAESFAGIPRWRLQGVRVAHGHDDHRDPPGEDEALLLEDLWPRLAPRTLVYDVETSGGRAQLEWALDEIRAFHLGERRPPGRRRGGGVFWASVAPG